MRVGRPSLEAAPTRYHAELAWVDGEVLSDVLIRCEGGRITQVVADTVRPADAVRLPGFVIPGLANGHSHAFHRALRARTHQGPGDFWEWRRVMYAVAEVLDPDLYHELATAVFGEMILAGVTGVGEFHYLHHAPGGRPYANPNEMGLALTAAAEQAGLRLTLLDTLYLRGGFTRELEGAQRRFGDPDADAWAARAAALSNGPFARRGAAVHSVRAVPVHALPVVVAWAEEHRAPLHFHLSEQPAENAECLAATGHTPTHLLADAGVLGPRSTAIHATHVTDQDVGILGSSSTSVCMCPTTERDLADGVGPARALAHAGSPLCVGSDSHAMIDLFEEARAMELNERLATLTRGHHPPSALLEALTTAGHARLGWEVALRPGALADFTAIDLRTERTAGATADTAVAHTVFAASACDVTDVVVGGRSIVRGGHHVFLDVRTALHGALAKLDAAMTP